MGDYQQGGKRINALDLGILLLLFLFSLNFLNYSNYIILVLFAVTCVRMLMVSGNPFMVNQFDLFILLFCFTYALIKGIYYQDMVECYRTFLLLPVISFFIGRMLYQISRKFTVLEPKNIMLVLTFGTFLYGILNIYYRYQMGYNLIWNAAENRMCIDFWSNKDIWPTVEAHFFLLIAALLFYTIFLTKSTAFRIVYFICLSLTIFAALDIGSRTLLVLMILVFVLLLLQYLHSRGILWRKKRKLLLGLSVVTAYLCFAYLANSFGLRTLVEDSSLYRRMTSTEVSSVLDINGRGIRYMAVISDMPTHLFGNIDLGGDLSQGGLGSAHNTWLDIYKEVGVIPFILFLWITALIFGKLRMKVKTLGFFHPEVILFVSIILMLNLQFLTESIFTSNMHIVQCYLIICGMLNASTSEVKHIQPV
jgi:hypothetical protein